MACCIRRNHPHYAEHLVEWVELPATRSLSCQMCHKSGQISRHRPRLTRSLPEPRPNRGHMRPSSAPNWSISPHIRPKQVQVRKIQRSSVELPHTGRSGKLLSPKLIAKIDRHRPNAGRSGPEVDQSSPELAQLGMISTKLGPVFCKVRPMLTEFGATSAKAGKAWENNIACIRGMCACPDMAQWT